jgi:branched-chain amino acid aminotransferase
LGVHPSKKAKFFAVCLPVGKYFEKTTKAIKLYADDKYSRAFQGGKNNISFLGTGHLKIGANYAGSIMPQKNA